MQYTRRSRIGVDAAYTQNALNAIMLKKLLEQKKDSILERWLERVLAAYPGGSSAAFRRQEDPFANPVGHSLRVGTREIFGALLDGMAEGIELPKIRQWLLEIIKIRAVQQFSASDAVCFMFQLKEIIRTELGDTARDPRCASDLTHLEGEIDRIALAAFDVFVECREKVYELRVNEMRRTVSWVVDRINKRGLDPELARIDLERERPKV